MSMAGFDLKDRYLTLLRDALCDCIYTCVFRQGTKEKVFSPAMERGSDCNPTRAVSMIGLKRMDNLRWALEHALKNGVKGDFMETGVWKGGACIFARGVLDANGATERRVIVADSFCGLPPPDVSRFPSDAVYINQKYDFLQVGDDLVRDNFRRFDLWNEETVVILKGYFEETMLGELPFEKLCVLRLDGDMYGSTMVVLQACYGRVSPGGVIIIDDWGLPHCRRAVEDFRAQNNITSPITVIDDFGAFWIKPISQE